jgi:O-antigen ligase
MFSKVAEKTTANLILLGSPLVTVFIVLSTVTDPVNAPKLLAAGGLGFGLLLVFLGFNFKHNFVAFTFFILGLILFASISTFTLVTATAPLTQSFYGVYGRNSGFLTYLLLALIAIGTLNLRGIANFRKVVLGLQIAGLINTIYCLWVLTFGDFLSWNNPYGNILGFFGNPNFVSSFLGIFIATLIAFAAAPDASLKYRVGAAVVSAIAFYEVVRSHAIQGIVVTIGGLAIIGFFVIRSRIASPMATYGYLVSMISLGSLALLGALQKGPFDFVYKTSVSLRGAYWNAGINMGMEHPLTGIGMDSYGDWYRRARSENAATVLPGPSTITNAAHNVVIDLFAFGGWPLLLSYLFLLVLSAIAIARVVRRRKTYEATFVAMTTAWICYQVQSLISINQIGLAIWGWLLTGALISYEYATREPDLESADGKYKGKSIKRKSAPGVFSPQLLAGLGVVVGLIVASPPMSADSNWRSALNSNNATQILAALEPSYLNPSNSQRYAQAVQLFANSNLMDQARQVALDAIEFNPDYFDAWKIFHALPNTTPEEKAEALENMQRLDPRNPDVLAQ